MKWYYLIPWVVGGLLIWAVVRAIDRAKKQPNATDKIIDEISQ